MSRKQHLKRARRGNKISRDSVFAPLGLVSGGPITPDMLDRLEEASFKLVESGVCPEVDVPTTHTFTKHSYVREGVMPAGSIIIGHHHLTHHHCVVLKGTMSILNPDRSVTKIVAPATFLAGPGRKVGFMHTDVVMQNIHDIEGLPTESIDALEECIYRRTEAFKRFALKKSEQKAIPV